MRRRLMLLSLMLIVCSVNSGCSVTLGPVVEREAVIVRPGKPVKIIENRTLRCEQLETKAHVSQDVGGWVAMPEEHWLLIKPALEKKP